uniref:Uncharacterized protein n=1 Tax=Eutreptiella gymnastica TaxID=73025 RepID=A0A7S4GBF4_9EUGL
MALIHRQQSSAATTPCSRIETDPCISCSVKLFQDSNALSNKLGVLNKLVPLQLLDSLQLLLAFFRGQLLHLFDVRDLLLRAVGEGVHVTPGLVQSLCSETLQLLKLSTTVVVLLLPVHPVLDGGIPTHPLL